MMKYLKNFHLRFLKNSTEMTYPGQVKVTVIRETRSVNVALNFFIVNPLPILTLLVSDFIKCFNT